MPNSLLRLLTLCIHAELLLFVAMITTLHSGVPVNAFTFTFTRYSITQPRQRHSYQHQHQHHKLAYSPFLQCRHNHSINSFKLFAKRQRNTRTNTDTSSNNKEDNGTNKEYNDDNNKNILSQIIQPLESTLSFLSTPIPPPSSKYSQYSLPLVYPLTIIGLNLLLNSVATIILLDLFFVLFYTFTRFVAYSYDDDDNDDDNDEYDYDILKNKNTLDLVALFGSIISAALISPAGLSFDRIATNTSTTSVNASAGLSDTIGLGLLLLCSSFGIVNLISDRRSDTATSTSNDEYDDLYEDMNNREEKKKNVELSEWDQKFREFGDK